MAYDEDLADRIRELLADRSDVREQRMFGGMSFLVGGNLAVAASSWGGVLVRVGPEASEELVATTAATQAEMGSRTMKGWLHVGAEDVRDDAGLRAWVDRGTSYAASLPPKAT